MVLVKDCRKFLEIKMIKLPQDVFGLNYEKIKTMDGWGQQSVANLRYAIEEKKNISLKNFICSWDKTHWF